MGQAKKRGTFEERRDAAIERKQKEEHLRHIKQHKRQIASHSSRRTLNTLLAISVAAGVYGAFDMTEGTGNVFVSEENP